MIHAIQAWALAAAVAALVAGPVWMYRVATVPRLAARAAPRRAYAIAAVPAVAAVLIGAALVSAVITGWPSIPSDVALGVLGVLTTFGHEITRLALPLSRRARSAPEGTLAAVGVRVDEAVTAFNAGDREASLAALRAAATTRTDEAAPLVDEIRAALPLIEVASAPLETVLSRLRAAEGQLVRREHAGKRRWMLLATLLVFASVFAPVAAAWSRPWWPCVAIEARLLGASTSARPETVTVQELLPTESEAGATLLFDDFLDLPAAADSRHDPDSLRLLEQAGFSRGHLREWAALDGRRLHLDVFEFETRSGALQYQRAVGRYACPFASEFFEGPGNAVGLRVRRDDSEHPVMDQVSWVSGHRRYLASVTHVEAPPSYDRVLTLVDAAIRHSDG